MTTDNIKPKIVDGKAVCNTECPSHEAIVGTPPCCTVSNLCRPTTCWPYYRSRVDVLEQGCSRIRDHLHLGSYDGTVNEHGIHVLLNMIDGEEFDLEYQPCKTCAEAQAMIREECAECLGDAEPHDCECILYRYRAVLLKGGGR